MAMPPSFSHSSASSSPVSFCLSYLLSRWAVIFLSLTLVSLSFYVLLSEAALGGGGGDTAAAMLGGGGLNGRGGIRRDSGGGASNDDEFINNGRAVAGGDVADHDNLRSGPSSGQSSLKALSPKGPADEGVLMPSVREGEAAAEVSGGGGGGLAVAASPSSSSPTLITVKDEDMATTFANGECGAAVLHRIGLRLSVTAASKAVDTAGDGDGDGGGSPPNTAARFIIKANQAGRDVQFAGRATSSSSRSSKGNGTDGDDTVLVLSPTIVRRSETEWEATFGPCYHGSGESDEGGDEKAAPPPVTMDFTFDIIATWAGTKFLGQKWKLPDRNDNPPFEMMRKKCLNLSLTGECEQFGHTLASSSSPPSSSSSSASAAFERFPPIRLKCLSRSKHAPSCAAPSSSSSSSSSTVWSPSLFGNGQWRTVSFPSSSSSSSSSEDASSPSSPFPLMRRILDDPVGLNHYNWGGASGAAGLGTRGDGAIMGGATAPVMTWEPPCKVANGNAKVSPIGADSNGRKEEGEEAVAAMVNNHTFFSHGPTMGQLGALTALDVALAMHRYFGGTAASTSPPSASSFVYTIALFGDSMMVEQFHMWCQLLHGEKGSVFSGPHVRQGKSMGLRWMHVEREFTIATAGSSSSSSPIKITLRVRFARSYTTKGGHSVLAGLGTIAKQLLSVDPDIIAGNLASLHWQQNMRSQGDWEGSLEQFGAVLRKSLLRRTTAASTEPSSSSSDTKKRRERVFYYWGNTMIQMGRTQGLNSGRTAAFNAAARRILGSLQHPLSPSSSSDEGGGGDGSHRGMMAASSLPRPLVNYFDPYHLSVARRESSFDGQHWACYHRYGGVSATITQLWLAHLCHVALVV